jgi:hypothetical protein
MCAPYLTGSHVLVYHPAEGAFHLFAAIDASLRETVVVQHNVPLLFLLFFAGMWWCNSHRSIIM